MRHPAGGTWQPDHIVRKRTVDYGYVSGGVIPRRLAAAPMHQYNALMQSGI